MIKKFIATVLAAAQMLFLSPGALSAEKTFPDVKAGKWYYNDIMEMTEAGWLAGYPDGKFRPMAKISASEFISIVTRLVELPPAATSLNHWAAEEMQAALDAGWYDWDEFPPTGETYNKSITRQVAVKVLMRATMPGAYGDYNTESRKMRDFSNLDGRYYNEVLAAYAEGIVVGSTDGCFHPKEGLSRAEACAIIRRASRKMQGVTPVEPDPEEPGEPLTPVETVAGGVSENGWLQVKGTQLCNEKGDPIVLHGMSTHGMQWYGQYASSGAIKTTASYGANLFRVAMYTGEGGYLSNPSAIQKQVTDAVDAAIKNDMYVIIDWHILSDGNPKTNLAQAKSFFAAMAKKYKDQPAVLYEICNEPNGNVSWKDDVKPYAEQMVKTIRDAGSNGVILIGSPTWSQDIHLAAADPVKGTNLMYTLHFYAGTHGKELRDRIDSAMKKGIAVFVSEWGTSRADGSGGVFLNESKTWLDFLDKKGISWANWSLCDKQETSAALKPGASASGGWKEKDLSESGKFVFSRF